MNPNKSVINFKFNVTAVYPSCFLGHNLTKSLPKSPGTIVHLDSGHNAQCKFASASELLLQRGSSVRTPKKICCININLHRQTFCRY